MTVQSTTLAPAAGSWQSAKRAWNADDDASAATGDAKRPRSFGPFVMDEDEDDDDDGEDGQDGRGGSLSHGQSAGAGADASFDFSRPFNFSSQDAAVDLPLRAAGAASATAANASVSGQMRRPLSPRAPTPPAQSMAFPPVLVTPRVSSPRPQEADREMVTVRTCSGRLLRLAKRAPTAATPYQQIVASRSTTAPGRASKSYYGVDIHNLLDTVAAERRAAAVQAPSKSSAQAPSARARPSAARREGAAEPPSSPLWTEKYRARRFVDLVGDDRTHRSVLRWLKAWDSIVFPGLARAKPKRRAADSTLNSQVGPTGPAMNLDERAHRKILLLAGPPGLGKTTLAHVCARQAGYEIMEINASDERSSNVVKNRIRDAIGTENVKSVAGHSDGGAGQKAVRPVCLVIDEVDGVVGGSGSGGEGGFVKALIELISLDKRNAGGASHEPFGAPSRKKKADKFRLLRPIILICNDVYHPSLRPLRCAGIAEIIHVRQAPLEKVINRMKTILKSESIPFETDGVRRLCEASWGISNIRNRTAHSRGVGEGDMRGILVAGEWLAKRLRLQQESMAMQPLRLTKRWVDQHFAGDAARDAAGLGRGGSKEVVDRVFVLDAGFASVGQTSTSASSMESHQYRTPAAAPGSGPSNPDSQSKRNAFEKLGHMIDASGDYDRCVTDCFLRYPGQDYQDDTFLSKPNQMYDWLDFHDNVSSRIYGSQSWELNKYMSQSVLAFHDLFASPSHRNIDQHRDGGEDDEDVHPFSGPKADFAAYEAQKQHRATLIEFQSSLPPAMLRLFRSQEVTVTELVPNVLRMLSPDIKPNTIRSAGPDGVGLATVRRESEKALVQSAVRVMDGLNVQFERAKVDREGEHGGYVYRMEPPLDTLVEFSQLTSRSTELPPGTSSVTGPARYAVRQVLAQEHRKELLKRSTGASQARLAGQDEAGRGSGGPSQAELLARLNGPKRDFFGRLLESTGAPSAGSKQLSETRAGEAVERRFGAQSGLNYAWVRFHDGFSNAVRKRITMQELWSGL